MLAIHRNTGKGRAQALRAICGVAQAGQASSPSGISTAY
jgi:hypothetical protein